MNDNRSTALSSSNEATQYFKTSPNQMISEALKATVLNRCKNNRKKREPRHDKTNKMCVRPAKTQISLGIRPVWSESSLCTQWIAKDPRFLHADSEDSDQTWQMPRLIWVFAGRTVTLLILSCRGPHLTCFNFPVVKVGLRVCRRNFQWSPVATDRAEFHFFSKGTAIYIITWGTVYTYPELLSYTCIASLV